MSAAVVMTFLVYSLTDNAAWADGEVWAATCDAALAYLVAGLRDGWAVHIIACGPAA
jgi:hypothetical protein